MVYIDIFVFDRIMRYFQLRFGFFRLLKRKIFWLFFFFCPFILANLLKDILMRYLNYLNRFRIVHNYLCHLFMDHFIIYLDYFIIYLIMIYLIKLRRLNLNMLWILQFLQQYNHLIFIYLIPNFLKLILFLLIKSIYMFQQINFMMLLQVFVYSLP